MEINKIFNTQKRPLRLNLRGYKFLGAHPEFNTVYFARKFDDNNFDFATMQVNEEMGMFNIPKYTFLAGSNIKILDTFMIKYLEYRKKMQNEDKIEELHKTVLSYLFPSGKELSKFKEMISTKIPEEIENDTVIKNHLDNNYKVLYVKNNASIIKHTGNTIDVVLYKEEKASEESTYILFKSIEFIRKKDKSFFIFEIPEIQIPTFLLK